MPEWKAFLDRFAKIEHGLLNVIAECLDHLIVRPGMAEARYDRSCVFQLKIILAS